MLYWLQAILIVTCAVKTLACQHELLARQASTNTSEYPLAFPGDDGPDDPATVGYFINHLCINARNATETIDWYNRAFGLRLIFRVQLSEHFSISYMGHSHGGRNGTGYQTSEELNRDKNNIEGLMEILSLEHPVWDLPPGMKMPNTFSHIGMVVPNVTETQARLEAMGANIIKVPGEDFEFDGAFANVTGFGQAGDSISEDEKNVILKSLLPLQRPLLMVADPDGTVIELQNQEGSAVV